jgi:flagellar biosynthesis anti-sigma factor FlgM
MSDVGPIGKPEVITTVRQDRHPRPASETPAPTSRPADSAEISQAAQLLNKLALMPDVRQDRIDQIRAQLTAGTYGISAKLDAAIENMGPDLL